MAKLRHKTVSVGIIHDPEQGYLLFYNEKWNGFAFCMKKAKPGEDFGDVALAALNEDGPLKFPDATAQTLDTVGVAGESLQAEELTYYSYWLYEIAPGLDGIVMDDKARYFKKDELLNSDEVTWSTKEILRAVFEQQEVALAVVSREVGGARQFLLVDNPGYGYFFPTVRRKQNEPAEKLAELAVAADSGYEGALKAKWCGQSSDLHKSERFGGTEREFTFQICAVDVPGVDLAEEENPFASALNARAATLRDLGREFGPRGYSDWFTEEELRSGTDLSSTVSTVLLSVLASVSQ